MQWEFNGFKLTLSGKRLLLQVVVAGAVGKLISVWYHLDWLACVYWILALNFFIAACKTYREASLKYFDDSSGTFQPRFSKRVRMQMFGIETTVVIALAALGLFVQLHP